MAAKKKTVRKRPAKTAPARKGALVRSDEFGTDRRASAKKLQAVRESAAEATTNKAGEELVTVRANYPGAVVPSRNGLTSFELGTGATVRVTRKWAKAHPEHVTIAD